MELKNIIEILCEYDIIHKVIYDSNGKIIRGTTDDETKTIFINPNITRKDLISTIIHELYHSRHYQNNEPNSEKKVTKESNSLYRKLFKQ